MFHEFDRMFCLWLVLIASDILILALLQDLIFRLSNWERCIFVQNIIDEATNLVHFETILFEVNFRVKYLCQILRNLEQLSQALSFFTSSNFRSILLALAWMSLRKVTAELLGLLELMVADWALVRCSIWMIMLLIRIDLFHIRFCSHRSLLDAFTFGPDREPGLGLGLTFMVHSGALKIVLISIIWNIGLKSKLLVLLHFFSIILLFQIDVMKIGEEVARQVCLWEGRFLVEEVRLVSFGKHFLGQIIKHGVRWRLWHAHVCCQRSIEQQLGLRHVQAGCFQLV